MTGFAHPDLLATTGWLAERLEVPVDYPLG